LVEDALTEKGFSAELLPVVRVNKVPVPVLLSESRKRKREELAVEAPQLNVVVWLPMLSARLVVGLVKADQIVEAEPAHEPKVGVPPSVDTKHKVPAPPVAVTKNFPVESVYTAPLFAFNAVEVIDPTTLNSVAGVVVPTPTLPPLVTRKKDVAEVEAILKGSILLEPTTDRRCWGVVVPMPTLAEDTVIKALKVEVAVTVKPTAVAGPDKISAPAEVMRLEEEKNCRSPLAPPPCKVNALVLVAEIIGAEAPKYKLPELKAVI
jgi:hypothetical protein